MTSLATIGYEGRAQHDVLTPLDIRDRFRAGNVEEGRELFREYVRGDPQAAAELERLASIIETNGDGHVAILCFEHDPRHCHRMVICEELAAAHGVTANHLGAPTVA